MAKKGINPIRNSEGNENLPCSEEVVNYKDLIDLSPDAIFSINRDSRFLYMNRAAASQLGGLPEDFIGLKMKELFPDEIASGQMKTIISVIDNDQAFNGESKSVIAGKERWFNTHIFPVWDNKKNEVFVQSIARDITTQKEKELELLKYKESLQELVEERTKTLENTKQALSESEIKFKSLYNHSPDMYVSVSPDDDTIEECNDTLLRKTGFTRKEIIGQKIFMMYHKDCKDDVKKAFNEFVESGIVNGKELILKRKDGSKIDVSLNVEAIRDKNGKILYSISSWRDISEWKKHQQAILTEKSFSENIINSLPGIFGIFDSNRRFQRWNKAFCDNTGYSDSEIENMTPLDLLKGSDKRKFLNQMNKLEKGSFSTVEVSVITKDKRSIPHYFISKYMNIEGNLYVISYGTDVSEIKEAQKALLESKQRYQLATEAADQGIWDWFIDSQVVYYSKQWKAQIGYKDEELENKFATWQNHLHPDDYERMHQEVAHYVENPSGPFIAEFRMRCKDGTYRWIRNRAASVKDKNGKVIRMFGAHKDITAKKEADEKLKENNNFINSVLNISPDIIYIYDIKEAKNVFSNEGFITMLDYTTTEIVEMGDKLLPMLMHPDDFQKYLTETYPKYKTLPDGELLIHQYRLKHKRGHWLWVNCKELIFNRDQDGSPRQIFGVFEDITEKRVAEEALRISEERLDLAQSAAGIGTFDWNILNDHTECNERYFELFGLNPDSGKFSEHNWLNRIHPDDRERARLELKDTLENEARYNSEYRILIPDGSIKWINSKAKIFYDEEATPVRMVGALTDVTDRILVMEKIKQSEEQYRKVFESVTDSIVICDYEGMIVDANPAACDTYGYSREEFLEMHPMKIVREDYYKVLEEFFETVLSGKTFYGETIDIRKDGSFFNTEIIGSTLTFQGKPHIMALIRDVTERKNQELKISESEAKYRTLASNLPGMVYRVEVKKNNNVLFFNDYLLPMTGYNKEELSTGNICSIESIMLEEDKTKVLSTVKAAIKKDEVFEVQYRIKKKNGTVSHFIETGKPIFDKKGKLEYIDGVIFDETSRRVIEEKLQKTLIELEESNEELEQFAYIASHDLQEPLRMVSSFLQLLVKKHTSQLNSEALEFINFAVDGSNRMRQLIKDLLAFSRVGTRGSPFEKTDMNGILKTVKDNLSESIKENEVKIMIKNLPEVIVDRTQIIQVFQNLISNAIKFKGKDNPIIEISAGKKKQCWKFRISDNGIGIEKQYMEKIFVIFQRLHTRNEYEGTGIGLAICKKIIERHGGRIWLDSTPGKGSEFFFTIPVNSNKQNKYMPA